MRVNGHSDGAREPVQRVGPTWAHLSPTARWVIIALWAVAGLGCAQALWDWRAIIARADVLLTFALAAVVAQFYTPSAVRYTLYHITPVFIFATVFLVGLGPAGIVVFAAYTVKALHQRRLSYIIWFNAANHFLAAVVAFRTYQVVAGSADTLSVVGGLGLVTSALLYVFTNHLLVTIGLRLVHNVSWRDAGTLHLDGMLADVLLLTVGVVLVVLWRLQPLFALLAFAPLMFVYRVLDIPALEEEARVDPKTGVYNARHINDILTGSLGRAQQLSHALSVLMADLDGLRDVNNSYGHLAGDDVLIQVAQTMKQVIGSQGIVGRFGGEEFVIVLPRCDAEEARAVAERLRKAIEGLEWVPVGGSEPVRVTITIGVASYPEHGSTATELLHKADEALYQGKDQGRNRVCVASKELIETGPSRIQRLQLRRSLRETGVPARADTPSPVPASIGIHRRALDLLIAVAAVAAGILILRYGPAVASTDRVALGMLALLVIASEALALDLYTASTVSMSLVGLLTGALLLGLPGVVVLAPIEAIVHAVKRRPPWYKSLYNASTHVLAGAAASLLFQAIHLPIRVDTLPLLLFPGAAATGLYYLVNVGLVVMAIALSERRSPLQVWREGFQWLWVHYLALGFIALVLAVAYTGLGVYGVLAFLIPLLIVRYAQKQYIDRTAENVQALKALNLELLAANEEVRQVNDELLALLAKVIDFRDPYVFNHSDQVGIYAAAIAEEMGLPPETINRLRRAAVFHDLGKIGIPDKILNKPGRLTDEEYAEIKNHVVIGAQLLESSHTLHDLIPAVLYHHERWDGKGYPEGLAGEEIPLEARILAVADVVDTMASDRPYKRGLSPAEILAELQRCSGTHFDPQVVEAFVRVIRRRGERFIVNSARRVEPDRAQWVPQPDLTPAEVPA